MNCFYSNIVLYGQGIIYMLTNASFFSKYDLYTKSTKQPNIAELKEYYQGLIDKYIPGYVKF